MYIIKEVNSEKVGRLTVNNLTIYPNPAQEEVNFRLILSSKQTISIKIYDLMGKLIEEFVDEGQTEIYDKELNVASWPSGRYIYNMSAGEFVSRGSFVVIR